jgi:hypothetical protein
MKWIACLGVLCTLGVTTGCISIKVGTEAEHSKIQILGLVGGYATVNALHHYEGNILEFGLFTSSKRPGELVSLDVWPVGGVGFGFIGGRVRFLPLEVALGTLFYCPKEPEEYGAPKPPPTPEPPPAKPAQTT